MSKSLRRLFRRQADCSDNPLVRMNPKFVANSNAIWTREQLVRRCGFLRGWVR